jgi:hypothetical protein
VAIPRALFAVILRLIEQLRGAGIRDVTSLDSAIIAAEGKLCADSHVWRHDERVVLEADRAVVDNQCLKDLLQASVWQK